jgi:hypothetical protein
LRAGERLTQAGPDDLSLPAAWTGLSKSIKNIPSSGSATFALDVDSDCSDYDSEIPIPTGTNVTIHGNGAVLDAAQKGGRFFNVGSGAALALDHLTLQHGSVGGNDVSAASIDFGTTLLFRKNPTEKAASPFTDQRIAPALLLHCYIPPRIFKSFRRTEEPFPTTETSPSKTPTSPAILPAGYVNQLFQPACS